MQLIDKIILAHRHALEGGEAGVVELDREPAVVAGLAENVDRALEVDDALAQLDEVANHRGAALADLLGGKARVPVLQVDVLDSVGILSEDVDLGGRN